MKSTLLFVSLLIAIGVSIFFTYQRSFLTRDFEVFNSEEDSEEMEEGANDEAILEEGERGTEEVLPDEDKTDIENDTSAVEEGITE